MGLFLFISNGLNCFGPAQQSPTPQIVVMRNHTSSNHLEPMSVISMNHSCFSHVTDFVDISITLLFVWTFSKFHQLFLLDNSSLMVSHIDLFGLSEAHGVFGQVNRTWTITKYNVAFLFKLNSYKNLSINSISLSASLTVMYLAIVVDIASHFCSFDYYNLAPFKSKHVARSGFSFIKVTHHICICVPFKNKLRVTEAQALL